MKTLNKGQDKIKQICDILRKDTIEPARKEGENIVAEASLEAEKIMESAKSEAARVLEEARSAVEQEKKVFRTALKQASRQCLEELKQLIGAKLFDEELHDRVTGKVSSPEIIASLISAIIKALEKDGIDTDISAIISKNASVDQVNSLLGEGIIKKLKEESVIVGDFAGGAMVRLHGKKIILDISSDALKELIASHLRKDFRTILFKS